MPAIFGSEMHGYREWLDADALGSLGGSMDSGDITDYYVSPYDIGYGRTVKFDHDFLGREALERVAAEEHKSKVRWCGTPTTSPSRSGRCASRAPFLDTEQ